MQSSDSLISRYSELVYTVSGSRWSVKLFRRSFTAGHKSAKSFYDSKIAAMEGEGSACDQSDANGFVCLNALRLKLRALRDQSA